MIPEIGMLIAGYVGFRCIEIVCRPASAFGSRGEKITVTLCGFLGILFAAVVVVDLMLGEQHIARELTKQSFTR